MTIGDVARRAGVRPSALRYYERVGLLPRVERVNGRRRYGIAILSRLAAIAAAKRAGFTIREIDRLLSEPSRARWRELAAGKLRDVEELIRRATTMKRVLEDGLRCRCATLDACPVIAKHAPTVSSPRRAPAARP